MENGNVIFELLEVELKQNIFTEVYLCHEYDVNVKKQKFHF